MNAKLIAAMLFLASCSIVSANYTNDFIVTTKDTLVCNNAKEGVNHVKATDLNGTSVKIDKEEVESYVADGKVYEKLPLYLNNQPTGQDVFLQILSCRNGLKLCKYTYTEDGENKNVLLVYNGNNFYVSLDKKNADSMLSFFHVSGVEVR
jgi:hypothetical protein